MNESTINIDVPFDWCHLCKMFNATTDRYYMDNGEVYYLKTYCEHEYICKEADRARRTPWVNDKKED